MIKKNYDGTFNIIVAGDISNENIDMMKKLPIWITEDMTFLEIHKQTIRETLATYGFLITVKNHEYTFKEFSKMVKDYFELTGKNKWYYDYLMNVNE